MTRLQLLVTARFAASLPEWPDLVKRSVQGRRCVMSHSSTEKPDEETLSLSIFHLISFHYQRLLDYRADCSVTQPTPEHLINFTFR